MKKLTFFLSFVCLANVVFAQWSSTTSNANNIYNTAGGYVGIGTNNPTCPLDINGLIHSNSLFVSDAQHAGDIGVWLRGASTGSANLVLQAWAGNNQAYWITGADGMLKIGANGGVEPSAGVININYLGNVGVGTTNPGSFKMAVEGAFGARSVKVTTIPWADYVFDEGYRLRPLSEIEKFILQYKHLPEVPTTAEVAKNGVDLGENQALLLKKVEELTLYLIEQQKQLQLQQKQIDALTLANKRK